VPQPAPAAEDETPAEPWLSPLSSVLLAVRPALLSALGMLLSWSEFLVTRGPAAVGAKDAFGPPSCAIRAGQLTLYVTRHNRAV
jgi:hypothetical protein